MFQFSEWSNYGSIPRGPISIWLKLAVTELPGPSGVGGGGNHEDFCFQRDRTASKMWYGNHLILIGWTMTGLRTMCTATYASKSCERKE